MTQQAILYRMVMPTHVCPYGLKAKAFLEHKGFTVDDRWLTDRAATDEFKRLNHVTTTPQAFLGESRIGGYDDLRRYFGKPVRDATSTTYRPVAILFVLAALLAVAGHYAASGISLSLQTLQWFVAISMILLALLKLQDVENFSTMFLNYDLLARRWVGYSYVYPYAEAAAGLLMLAGVLIWPAASISLFIGSVGAISVIKAVYVDKRELNCACVGGSSNVPLGFVSLTENLLMVGMGVWMLMSH